MPGRADEPVGAVDPVVRRLEPGLARGVRVLRRRLPRVQHRCVIELLEGVHVDLPVRLHLGAVVPALRHLVEGIALERRDHRPEEVPQRLLGLLGEVHEDEAFPHLAVHGDEAVLALVQVEELALLLDEGQRALEVVTPAVVLAGELAAGAARLLARVVLPHQLVAAVAADVVEGAHPALHVAHDDDRCPRRRWSSLVK